MKSDISKEQCHHIDCTHILLEPDTLERLQTFQTFFLTPLYTPFTSSELINSLLFVLLTCYICTHIHDVVFQVETQNLIITFHDLFTSPHMIGSRLQ